jgi:UDP-N-acetylmuramoyl-tripeptide--D-alanyl-D-alanine ligase
LPVVRFRASEIAAVVGGELVGPDVEVDGVGIDSRDLRAGQAFVPVVGERDGHDFIGAALDAGAAAYLTARPPVGGTAVVVDDPAAALTALGAAARSRLPYRVVGITGSVGKTSTKDLAARALGRRYRVHASARSFNNELGVPITLVDAPDDTEVTIVEMGARGIGHIAELCVVARPTIAVVTAVEMVHTQLFGDLETVATAKRELVEALPPTGVAVLNAANPYVRAMAAHTHARVVTFGTGDVGGTGGAGAGADVRAVDVVVDDELRPSFRLESPWGGADVHLAVRGRHQVTNALAAAAVALVSEVAPDDVAAGLAEASLSPWRMELTRTGTGALVLNDAYNAGPASMEAALRSLADLPADRRMAVLGPMAELGDESAAEHRRIAALAVELGIRVIAVGSTDYGGGVDHVDDLGEALEAVGSIGTGDAVLVKGSRVAGLERLAATLVTP